MNAKEEKVILDSYEMIIEAEKERRKHMTLKEQLDKDGIHGDTGITVYDGGTEFAVSRRYLEGPIFRDILDKEVKEKYCVGVYRV